LSIRRFAATPLRMDDVVNYHQPHPGNAEVLRGLSKAKVNILISGGTGTGKTTMLNISPLYPRVRADRHDRGRRRTPVAATHVVRLETRR